MTLEFTFRAGASDRLDQAGLAAQKAGLFGVEIATSETSGRSNLRATG